MTEFEKLIEKLNGITGVSFVSIKDYPNYRGETSDYLINVGVTRKNAIGSDIEYLNKVDVNELKTDLPKEVLGEAVKALLGSLKKPSETHSKGQKDAYEYIANGLKVNKKSGEIYITGMKVKKHVKAEADEKEDTRRDLTKAKDLFREGMKSTKVRNFTLTKIKNIVVSGDTIVIQYDND